MSEKAINITNDSWRKRFYEVNYCSPSVRIKTAPPKKSLKNKQASEKRATLAKK